MTGARVNVVINLAAIHTCIWPAALNTATRTVRAVALTGVGLKLNDERNTVLTAVAL